VCPLNHSNDIFIALNYSYVSVITAGAMFYEPWLMRLGDISVGYLYSLQAAV